MLNHSVWVVRVFSAVTCTLMLYMFFSGNYLHVNRGTITQFMARIDERPLNVDAIDPTQYECLRENIYFEARNQPLVGQVMVGLTVINRVRDDRFDSTICDVVFARKQYSWANSGRKKPNLKNKQEVYAWEMSGKIAEYIMRYDIDIGNVTHYHTTSIKKPKWAKSKQFVTSQIIGDHIFYTLRDS